MSATLEKTEATPTQYPLTLTDRLPERAKLSWPTMALVAVLGIVFAYASFQPLTHTDLFSHLQYGSLVWATKALPATEPFMPLAEGVPFVDTAWLSQVVGYGLFRAWGYAGLQFAYALLITLSFSLMARRLFERSQHLGVTLLGLLATGVVGIRQLETTRPQLAGFACFLAILFLLTARRWTWRQWVGIPLAMGLWANLHGSFFVGLMVLGCLLAGRAWDVVRATGKLEGPFADGPWRRLLLVTELSLAATLLTPYGASLYPYIATFGSNPNMADLVEWDPMQLRSYTGIATAVVTLALVWTYRKTPRRIPAGEFLMVAGLLLCALWSQRMAIWYAPVAGAALAWNLHAFLVKLRNNRPYELPAGQSRWTFVTAALMWISVGYTPFGMLVIHRKAPDLNRTLSSATPLRATEFLRKNPPQGQVFNTMEWGDYLMWSGPRGIRVFAASHVQFLPAEVWRSYMSVINGNDWEQHLDKYGVNTIVLDNLERRPLIKKIGDDGDWQEIYKDGLATIFKRKKPI